MKHPDQAAVKTLVAELLSDGRRGLAEWHVEMLDYDFYSSTYHARLSLDKNSAVAKIPSEMIDDVFKDNDKFKRRRIKHLLKDAVEKFFKLEEE